MCRQARHPPLFILRSTGPGLAPTGPGACVGRLASPGQPVETAKATVALASCTAPARYPDPQKTRRAREATPGPSVHALSAADQWWPWRLW